jgi:hypothetical protein
MVLHDGTGLGQNGTTQSRDLFVAQACLAFKDVEVDYWPQVRWWLPEGIATDRTIDKNLKEIYDSGFGGVEIIAIPEEGVDHTIYGWGSEEWNEDSRRVIKEATRLGLAFSLTSGAHWATANLPDTHTYAGQPYHLDNIAAAQELDYASAVVRAGETLSGPVPRLTLPDKAKHAKAVVFLGAIAVKVERERQPVNVGNGVFIQTQGMLDLKTTLDITDSVTRADDALTFEFTAPRDGDYEVFAFYVHGTGQTADPSTSVNFTINYFDPYGAEALTDYWNRNVLTDQVKADLQRSGRGELYMDSLELSTYGRGGLLWGFTLRDEFKKRRGYDVFSYLPFLVRHSENVGADASIELQLLVAAGAVRNGGNGRVITNYLTESDESRETINMVMNDLYRTMTELYCGNTLGPLRAWLHRKHMKLRAEPSYGYTLEISTPAKYLDGVETESYAQCGEIDLYRNMLGSANMYAKPFSSETGAVRRRNYYYNMDDWTQLAYLQFAVGVVRTVLHGWAGVEGPESSTYWPGHEGMYPRYSERFDGRQPASFAYKEWTMMLARNQKFLRVGVARRDLAVLRTDYAFANYDIQPPGVEGSFRDNYTMHDRPYYWKDLSLQAAGYGYDYFSAQLLADDENILLRDNLLQPDTVGYRAVIVYQETLELDGARGLLRVAKSGVPVLFVNGVTETINHLTPDVTHIEAASRTGSLLEDPDELRRIVESIKALPNVATVERQADVLRVLRDRFDVRPRAGFTDPSPELLNISRYDETAGVLNTFIYSYKFYTDKGAPARDTTLVLEGEGKPYILDDWTGAVVEARGWWVRDGRTFVPISLAPGETLRTSLDLRGLHGDGRKSSTPAGASSASHVAWKIDLPVWDITVEDWNEGEKVVITETKFGHETREQHFTTRKTQLTFGASALVPWRDLPATAEQLRMLAGDNPDAYGKQILGRAIGGSGRTGVDTPSMSHVSGIGTYATTFTVPAGAPTAHKVYLQIGSTSGGLTVVRVNGLKAPAVSPRTLRTDISDLIVPGENRLVVEVASTLTNRVLQKGYETQGPYQDCGMTGEVAIVAYR